ncbi:MAG TPA: 30S ribosomal protein S19e [Candidatus Nanoarchaeia archaeon]|nr:30S ribosomal protein S19e [Candidatus Nanoarchaeia archaeon]
MTTALEVNPHKLIKKVAEELKEKQLVQPPLWSAFVKTGTHADRPPTDKEWWYARSAAVLRSVYRLGPVGTSKLRTKYGGRKNRGYKPEHFFRGSGSIIRKVLQQLEKSGLISQAQRGTHKGRVMTKKGKSFIDKIAAQIAKSAQKPVQAEAV